MGRQERIARSIVRAIVNAKNGPKKRPRSPLGLILTFFSTLFSLYQLALHKVRPAEFANLRRNHWHVSDDDYIESFQPSEGRNDEEEMKAIGDMGFSGSVSFGQ